MLPMVNEKPMQLTIVSAVPLISAFAFCATSVEKSGESAMTTIPQKRRNPMNMNSCSKAKTNGEARQQAQERQSAIKAVRFVPTAWAT